MGRKYDLSSITIRVCDMTLHRIRALRDFSNVKKGDLGGFIKNESNLSHDGDCWVYGGARVYCNAHVAGHARICDNARIYGNAQVYGDIHIYDKARIYGDAHVFDHARICDNAQIYGNAHVFDYARVYGNAQVSGNAWVIRNAQIYGNAQISGEIRIWESTHICGDACISTINPIYMTRNIKLDHGVWIQEVKMGNKHYLISSTLEKLCLG